MIAEERKVVKEIPEGYSAVTPWVISPDSNRLIKFMKSAFGAEEISNSRMTDGNGRITHVEVRVGDSVVMLFDAGKDWPATPAFIRLFVDDCESSYQKALKAGGRSVTKPTMLAFGDKVSRIADPFGNIWWIQERVEDLTNVDHEEIDFRMQQPEALKAMKYVEDSLNSELKKRTLPASL